MFIRNCVSKSYSNKIERTKPKLHLSESEKKFKVHT